MISEIWLKRGNPNVLSGPDKDFPICAAYKNVLLIVKNEGLFNISLDECKPGRTGIQIQCYCVDRRLCALNSLRITNLYQCCGITLPYPVAHL